MKEPKDVMVSFRMTNSDYIRLLKLQKKLRRESGNNKITVTEVITECIHVMLTEAGE